MLKQEYISQSKRMEELLGILSNKRKLTKKLQAELDELSNSVAEYEETYHAFKPDNLKEMIELRMYQRK